LTNNNSVLFFRNRCMSLEMPILRKIYRSVTNSHLGVLSLRFIDVAR
jgi:hypothetical protein